MRPILLAAILILAMGCLSTSDPIIPSTTTTTLAALCPDPVDCTVAEPDKTATTLPLTDPIPPVPTTIGSVPDQTAPSPTSTLPSPALPYLETFGPTGNTPCLADGLPIVRMYVKNGCEHCEWAGATFDRVAAEYVAKGKLRAHHWDFGTGDDKLSEVVETEVPKAEARLFYDSEAKGTVPYYLIGCIYSRVGNGYYIRDRIDLEEQEFRKAFDTVIAQSTH